MSSIELSLFSSRLSAVCEEMGASLRRSAFSPNIKDRLDYSCAVFGAEGQLCAQAAHIPVHLGSMAFAMAGIVQVYDWQEGDILIVNDPFLGGTHLPDVTVVAPVFLQGQCVAFVANRAHHANIGASAPGSMPIATHLEQEGEIIPPTLLVRDGHWQESVLFRLSGGGVDTQSLGDYRAQVSACQLGAKRAQSLVAQMGVGAFKAQLAALNAYAENLATNTWKRIPDGVYPFTDWMDGDGIEPGAIPISIELRVKTGHIIADFAGTAGQVRGNINCPLSVTAAGVYYALRCLLPSYAPACAGTFAPIEIIAQEGSLVNAKRPAAVAAGNVETSSRIVDVVFGALAKALPESIPAASQGSMNNLAMGAAANEHTAAWNYYETLGGGGGAGPKGPGLSGRQTHMTNTLNTPVESLEQHYPIRVTTYALRKNSGGLGLHTGGDGVVRSFEFLAPAQATLLTERRTTTVWGLGGAEPGTPGRNCLNGEPVGAKTELHLKAGDQLSIETPGGGGWNSPSGSR